MKYYHNLKVFFEDNLFKYRENIALKYENIEYSYQALDEKSKQYVNLLISWGVKIGETIAISNTKSFNAYALMVACIKTGVIYVNIDMYNPLSRLIHIFNTCKPKKLFYDNSLSENLIQLCKIQGISSITLEVNINAVETTEFRSFDGNRIAYIMFTSGSTGKPKGVAITHQNIIHFINWGIDRYGVSQTDNFANLSPMYFDNSVFDFYIGLFSGATLTPVSKDLLSKPLELVQYIDKMHCTIWFSVPSLLIYLLTMRVLTKESLTYIRMVTFGGEGFPKTELKKLYNLYSDRMKFINVYGPTECTCICSSYEVYENDFDNLSELPPLGKINQNFSYIILDKNNNESNIGELCLFGPSVGLGYYNDIKKTKESFTYCRSKNFYMSKMYKTGDVVEKIDNLLYFKGRVDNQIKHMGYRIELEEIEIALNSISEIDQSAVIYFRLKTSYGKIVAFIGTYKKIDSMFVKDKLFKLLPEYMVPCIIKVMKILPKNANGKIDKQKLQKQLKV